MRFTVQRKLLGGFATVVLLLLVVGVVALIQESALASKAAVIGKKIVPSVEAVKEIDAASMDYRGTQFARMTTTDARQTQALTAHLGGLQSDIAKTFANYSAHLVSDGRDRALTNTVRDEWNAYLTKTRGFLAADNAQANARANAVLQSGVGVYGAMQHNIDLWRAYNDKLAAQAMSSAQSTQSSARLITIGLLILAVAAGIGIALFIARSITSGVQQVRDAAEAIADGDVGQSVDVRSRDEVGETAEAFGRMIEYLQGMVGAADRIAGGDLTVEISPRSEHDALGNAFQKMVANLRAIVGGVSQA